MSGENVPALIVATDESLAAVMASEYLPRFQVTQGMSKIVKAEICPQNVFAMQYAADRATNLGKEVNLLLISARPKALDTNDPVTEHFDVNAPGFKATQKQAMVKDSGCMFGVEFLIWLPNEGGPNGTFASWFCGSKTSRREAPGILALMKNDDGTRKTDPSPITAKIRMIPGGKHTWPGTTTSPCATAFATLPDPEELAERVHKFNNPPASKVEKVEPTPDSSRAR